MVNIFGRNFEHLTIIREITLPVRGYAVKTDENYYIRKPTFDENVYKGATSIYETDDIDAIIVIHESELPEDYIYLGTPNQTETI